MNISLNLPAHYATLREAALHRFAQGEAEIDSLLDSQQDTRRGLTLLARPPAAVAEAITTLLSELQQVEPAQYYYPAPDLHLTVLSLISCHPGFALTDVDVAAYRQVVARVVHGTPPFVVQLSGLTASPGGILVQGFPADGHLNTLRTRLREAFQTSGLPQSIDQRYRLQTAHLTVARFRQPPRSYQHLIDFVEKYQQQVIGPWEVASLELVFNDCYQRQQHTVLLQQYPLPFVNQL